MLEKEADKIEELEMKARKQEISREDFISEIAKISNREPKERDGKRYDRVVENAARYFSNH